MKTFFSCLHKVASVCTMPYRNLISLCFLFINYPGAERERNQVAIFTVGVQTESYSWPLAFCSFGVDLFRCVQHLSHHGLLLLKRYGNCPQKQLVGDDSGVHPFCCIVILNNKKKRCFAVDDKFMLIWISTEANYGF